jgi:hypothetical protein
MLQLEPAILCHDYFRMIRLHDRQQYNARSLTPQRFNGFVLACRPGAELGKSPVFKGCSHWGNGFVLAKKKKVTGDE